MPTSYKTIIGNAISVCDKASGGVKKAATIKTTKIIYFLIRINVAGCNKPTLHKTKVTTGISKTTPKGKMKPSKKPTYSLSESIGVAKFSPI